MIVLKFGGTSVEDTAALKRAAAIVGACRDRTPVVVVSALAGVTNRLIEAIAHARSGDAATAVALLDLTGLRHGDTADEAVSGLARGALDGVMRDLISTAETALIDLADASDDDRGRLPDAILAVGELLSSHLVAAAFTTAGVPARAVDIRPAMRTNADFGRAAVDRDVSEPLLRDLFAVGADPRVPVTQGFLGATADGITTTIGRGGSDLSATILGAALDAEEVQIWTDVDGILTTDPRIVPEAGRIDVISFAEASELAYFGAKVLHPSTLRPAMTRDIPVRVLNSRNPEGSGTTILRTAPKAAGPITAIAFKRGITVFNVASDRMLMAHGFLARLFEVFSRHETAVDMVTTSEVSVSMTLDDTRRLDAIRADLARLGDVAVDENQAIVCLVGESLKRTPGLVPRIFDAVRDLPVSMISHGASAINLSFVTPGDRVEEAVRALHGAFFGERVETG